MGKGVMVCIVEQKWCIKIRHIYCYIDDISPLLLSTATTKIPISTANFQSLTSLCIRTGHNSNPYFAVLICVRAPYFVDFQIDKFVFYDTSSTWYMTTHPPRQATTHTHKTHNYPTPELHPTDYRCVYEQSSYKNHKRSLQKWKVNFTLFSKKNEKTQWESRPSLHSTHYTMQTTCYRT